MGSDERKPPDAAASEQGSETSEEIGLAEIMAELDSDREWRTRSKAGLLQTSPNAALFPSIFAMYLSFLACSLLYWRSSYGTLLWVSGEAIFASHEYWRLFTAIFTHADAGHWLSNGPLFLIFGWYLRSYFGFLAFPVLPLLTGALANLTTVYFYEPSTRLVGASGMLYAMVAFWIVYYVAFEVNHSVLMRIFRSVGFSLIVLFPTTFNPTTSYLAHASGFFLGVTIAAASIPLFRGRALLKSHVAVA